MATMMMGHFAVIPFLSKYTVSNQGFSEHQLTYIYLFGGIATVITSPLTGRLADKFGKKKLFLIALPFSFIPILLITNMPRVPMWMVLTSSTLFFIFATARMIPLQALISSTVEPKNRGAFMSINSSIQQFSAGVASLLAGYIVIENPDKTLSHYNYVGYFAVAMLCLCFYFITKVHSIESKKE
jgi:predicted MFS family arabinose efflux permease